MSSTKLQQWLYDHAPVRMQNLLLNAYALKLHRQRYNKRFTELTEILRRTQQFNKDQIIAYQNQKLQKLIDHAYHTVPYYRAMFDQRHINPKDIRTTEDLRYLPLLTKNDLKENIEILISRAAKRKYLTHGHTSGTTGSPLDVYWDQELCIFNNAVDWRQKDWAGVSVGQPIALLLGRPVVAIERTSPPYWQLDRIHNQLWMSSFHMSEQNLPSYVKKLLDFKPVAIEGYPSTLFVLADFLLRQGIRFPLNAAFSSSETLHTVQRETIEETFQCKLYDFYGMAERVVFATECSNHDGRHLNFEYGITEIVDQEGKRVPEGEMGFIVGTSLVNFGMPLIRYKTSDITKIHSELCPCGIEMPLIDEIASKAEDMIIRLDGTPISPSVLTHPFKPLEGIEKSQIIQEKADLIIIKIVKKVGFSEQQQYTLLKEFQKRVGDKMRVEIQYVDDIPRTVSGKYRWVISKIAAKNFDWNRFGPEKSDSR